MGNKLPQDGVYDDRSKASTIISITLAEEHVLNMTQLTCCSSKLKVVFMCPSSKNYWVQYFILWAVMSKDDKNTDLDNKEVLVDFPIHPAEGKQNYNIRQ